MKKTWTLLLIIPLLAACDSFTGLASERYNGREIVANEEAIAAYAKRQEVIGKEKEALAADIPDFFYQTPLEWSEEAFPLNLDEEAIVIGKDVPEGRYTVVKSEVMESGYLTVRDAADEVVFQHFLDFNNDTFELNLYEGLQLSANKGHQPRLNLFGIRKEPGSYTTFIGGPEPPPAKEGQLQLYNGIHHIGVEVEPGWYDITTPPSYSGSGVRHLYILNPDKTFRAFELNVSAWEHTESGLELELEAGQILYVSNVAELQLTPIEK